MAIESALRYHYISGGSSEGAALVASVDAPSGRQTLAMVLKGIMGGRGGFIPASIALRAGIKALEGAKHQAEVDPKSALSGLLREAHENMLEVPRRRPVYGSVGAIIAAGWATEQCIALAHSGDCRIHRYRKEEGLVTLTIDHSLLEDIKRVDYAAWKVAAEESMYKDVLTRCLGFEWSGAPPGYEPWEMQVHKPEMGDLYIFGSKYLAIPAPSILEASSLDAMLEAFIDIQVRESAVAVLRWGNHEPEPPGIQHEGVDIDTFDLETMRCSWEKG